MANNEIDNDKGAFGEVLPPDFFIQEKIGTSAQALITAERIKSAEKCIQGLKPTILHALDVMLHDIATLSRVRPRGVAPQIWRKAHEIRGIAGTANRNTLGKFCNLICFYLNNTDENFRPSADLITDLSVAANYAMSETADTDQDIAALFEVCKIAVEKQKSREGRHGE
jgi:hypothetical protein